MSKYFSKNLKYLRIEKKISQQELADKLNVDRSTISRWESDDMDATVGNVIQIANILNVPIEDLTGKDMTNNNYNFDELELLFSKYKDILTDDDKETIKFLIEKRKRDIDNQENNK